MMRFNRAAQQLRLDRVRLELLEMMEKAEQAGIDPDDNAYAFHLRNAIVDLSAASVALWLEREQRRSDKAGIQLEARRDV
jgi:hypothetical protein